MYRELDIAILFKKFEHDFDKPLSGDMDETSRDALYVFEIMIHK